jgi:hypothetical protein
MNNISSDTLYWIFSTMPQTLAAFVGLVIAGVCFIQQRIDDVVETDSTFHRDIYGCEEVHPFGVEEDSLRFTLRAGCRLLLSLSEQEYR